MAQEESLPYGNDELLPNTQINYWQSGELGITLIVQADESPMISRCLQHHALLISVVVGLNVLWMCRVAAQRDS